MSGFLIVSYSNILVVHALNKLDLLRLSINLLLVKLNQKLLKNWLWLPDIYTPSHTHKYMQTYGLQAILAVLQGNSLKLSKWDFIFSLLKFGRTKYAGDSLQ